MSGNYPMQGPVAVDEMDNEIKMVRFIGIFSACYFLVLRDHLKLCLGDAKILSGTNLFFSDFIYLLHAPLIEDVPFGFALPVFL